MGVPFTKLGSFGWCSAFDCSSGLSLLVKVGLARCTALWHCDLFKNLVRVNYTSSFKGALTLIQKTPVC